MKASKPSPRHRRSVTAPEAREVGGLEADRRCIFGHDQFGIFQHETLPENFARWPVDQVGAERGLRVERHRQGRYVTSWGIL